MDFQSKLKEIITKLLDNIHEQRKLILALSCIVVFVTTYVLILPAFTLEKTEAAKQGGIDVPGVEQAANADSDGEAEAADETDAAPASKAKEAKTEKAAKESKHTKQNNGSSDVTLQNEDSEDFTVAVEGKDDVLSEDMRVNVREIDRSTKKLKKEYDSLYSDALEAVQKEEGSENSSEFAFAKFYDISLMDGQNEVEPDSAVDVIISFGKDLQKELKAADPERVHIVHFVVDEDTGEVTPEVLGSDSTDISVKNNKVTEASFTTDSFSVFALVYTVDFHYEVDGKQYEFSMDGGSYISLTQLVEKIGIGSADTESFVADVESVTFSDPELVWVGKAEKDTTVGELKNENQLEPEYSKSITKKQKAEIDAQTVKTGDWILISLKPFTSEETLTITMKNGDQWSVRVTDWVEGAYGQSVNIDIYGDGSITLGEYVHPYDWDWMGTYDHEERRTYYSYKNLSLSVRYGSNTNNQDIVANPASGYTLDHWELRDNSTGEVTTYTSSVIPAGTVAFRHDSTLTAVFSKSSGGGGTEPIDFNQITQEWIEKITKDQPVVNKTASVYDYKNRIYQIDIAASSELYAVNQNLDIDFVTDVSGSMHFPSKLETVSTFNYASDMSTQLDNVVRQNHNGQLPYSTPVGELYYMILDPQGASNVFVLRRYNGQWWALAGDTLEQINYTQIRGRGYDNWRQLNVADNNGNVVYTNLAYPDPVNGGTYNPIVEKKIYMATDSTLRMVYLQQALYLARDVLYKINPDAKIGLTTFAATANQGQFYGSNQQAALTDAITNIATQGGTNQAEGLAKGKDLLDSDPDDTKKKIAVLITDGAPNGCTWDQILHNAQNMKDDNIDVYTVGLSVENVQGASDGLFHTSNGAGYAFDAKDGRGLVEAIESIIESVVKKANMTGSVSDTIDPAFYPVAKDGTPLQPGVEYEDENGHKYTLAKSGETWTVNWDNQSFGWAYTDMQGEQPGWKGTVYVKAKENFVGGNAIKTNSNTENDKITVTGFETFTYNDDDELVIINSGELKDENGQAKTVTKTLETPYVNVDELALTQNSTEWNVYLGTEVDPKSALEELLKKIDIRKVVSGDTNEMITSKDQMLGGTSDSSKTMALTDYLSLTTDAQIKALVNDLLTNGSKTYLYNNDFDSAYGHGYVGDIMVSLVDKSGCYNKENHATEAVGKDAEFTLKVEYRPKNNGARNAELGITADKYHNGTGSPGEPVPEKGNDMTSSNHHVINVYAKGLQITKVDLNDEVLTGAKFTLYRTARAGDDTSKITEIDGVAGSFFPVTELDTSETGIATKQHIEKLKDGEKYYLVETQTPEGYITISPIPVNLNITNTYTPKPGTQTQPNKPETGIYDWNQEAVLILDAEGGVKQTNADNTEDLTHSGNAGANSTIAYYRITNNPGVELPHTGGLGTTLIYILGIILTCAAGAGLVLSKRRKAA